MLRVIYDKMILKNDKTIDHASKVLKELAKNNFKKIPILYPEFKEKVIYKISNKFFVPEYEGVYFVHDMRGFLYIGETLNLRQRFLQHLQREKNQHLKQLIKNPFGDLSFYWIKANSKLEALKLQKYWIRSLKPFTNKTKYKSNI